jgi:tetratricopeptide (TPR) repeat protein
MFKFCPKCGYKLVQEFKFCPECGFGLEKVRYDKSNANQISGEALKETGYVGKKICDNCGEENNIENIICSGCGIIFTGILTGKFEANSTDRKENVSLNVKSKSVIKPGNSKNTKGDLKSDANVKIKSLNKAGTVTIIAVGVGIAIIILIFSGLLNSIIVPRNTTNTSTIQNSSVDLSSIQKINDLESVVKNNPLDTISILELAQLKNDAGMFEQAIINYKQYLSLVPKDANARIDMGICYYNLQNYDTAINEMEIALKYNPKHQIGNLDLGIVNLAAGKMEKSQEWLKKAVEIDPNSESGKKAQELLSSHNNKINGGK